MKFQKTYSSRDTRLWQATAGEKTYHIVCNSRWYNPADQSRPGWMINDFSVYVRGCSDGPAEFVLHNLTSYQKAVAAAKRISN